MIYRWEDYRQQIADRDMSDEENDGIDPDKADVFHQPHVGDEIGQDEDENRTGH